MEDNSEMQRRSQAKMRTRKPWIDAARVPFRDNALMTGPPSCTAADFKKPRLRRCPFDPAELRFEARLGGGLDGYVWKVDFGDEGPFALKVVSLVQAGSTREICIVLFVGLSCSHPAYQFWDNEPPEFAHYYAPQRECQNAALLQMMETAVERAAAASRPIQVIANPFYWDDALDNQAAFSDEARLKPPSPSQQESDPALGPDSNAGAPLRPVTAIPRMRKCYGWLALHSDALWGFPWWLRPPVLKVSKVSRCIQSDREYTAIVYEYVDEGENDAETVQEDLNFFWLAGFGRTLSQLAKNWKSGVLVDLCDIIRPPRGYGWHGQRYKPISAAVLVQTMAGPDEHDPVNAFRPRHLPPRPNPHQPSVQAPHRRAPPS